MLQRVKRNPLPKFHGVQNYSGCEVESLSSKLLCICVVHWKKFNPWKSFTLSSRGIRMPGPAARSLETIWSTPACCGEGSARHTLSTAKWEYISSRDTGVKALLSSLKAPPCHGLLSPQSVARNKSGRFDICPDKENQLVHLPLEQDSSCLSHDLTSKTTPWVWPSHCTSRLNHFLGQGTRW